MGLKSGGRKLSFDILSNPAAAEGCSDAFLYRSKLEPSVQENGVEGVPSKPNRRKRKHNKKKKLIDCAISENSLLEGGVLNGSTNECVFENGSVTDEVDVVCKEYSGSVAQSVVICEQVVMEDNGGRNVSTVSSVSGGAEVQSLRGGDGYLAGELRQRTVSGGGVEVGTEEAMSRIDENENENANAMEENSSRKDFDPKMGKQWPQPNGNIARKLEKDESLDWKRLMTEDLNYSFSVEKSPVKYFMEEMYSGNSLQSTTTIGDEKERERVYDTIFRLPWRCELLIDVGFFVCLDSFLSLLTIMPARIVMAIWKLLKTRQFRRLSAAELSDFGCFIVLAIGVALLQQADISLIYHMIRGQGTIKLYVVYNVLEIFDKLCQSFGGDVMQTLFKSTEGLANCTQDNRGYWLWRFISDESLSVVSSIVHSFVLLAQAITLSTCIVAHNNALFALLVSNNFAEIKSNVFKRFSKDNIHSLVYFDSVERFHISAFVLFVLAQNILEAEGPWFESFLYNALLVYVCEMMIDIIKHSFIAKFNDIKPIVFSEFLEDLCKQTLNMQTQNGKKNLTFVPLAPACVVIRVLSPVYAAHLPHSPLPWRIFWIFLLSAMTFVMLASLKVLIGMSLQKHATWYINRCRRRKLHTD